MNKNSTSLTGCMGMMAGIIMPRLIVQKTWVIPPAAKNLKPLEPAGTVQGSVRGVSLNVQKQATMTGPVAKVFQTTSISFAMLGHVNELPFGCPRNVYWMKQVPPGRKSIFKSLATLLQ